MLTERGHSPPGHAHAASCTQWQRLCSQPKALLCKPLHQPTPSIWVPINLVFSLAFFIPLPILIPGVDASNPCAGAMGAEGGPRDICLCFSLHPASGFQKPHFSALHPDASRIPESSQTKLGDAGLIPKLQSSEVSNPASCAGAMGAEGKPRDICHLAV